METGTAISRISAYHEPLALVCGLPSSLTYFVADLCRDILARAQGDCEVIGLNDLGPESVERLSAAAGPMLLLADIPDAAVAELASEAEFPIIVVDQSFAAACRDFMAARGTELVDAARTMARCHVGSYGLAAVPRACLIGADERAPAAALAENIAAALAISEEVWRPMVAERGLDRSVRAVLDETFAHTEIGPPQEEDARALLDKLDRFYGFHVEPGEALLEMPMSMLLEAAPPHLPATETIELVGPARCLTFGPYLFLPRGRWRATFTFLSLDNRSGNTIGIDIAADHEIKVDRDFDLHASGKFAFNGEFDIDDPYSPLEFRTFLRRGSIEGRFQPLSLTLEPCGDREAAIAMLGPTADGQSYPAARVGPAESLET